jgi:hypothetical protein
MTGLIVGCLCFGFGFTVMLFFAGYSLRVIDIFTRWK